MDEGDLVEVVPYDLKWPLMFQEEKKALERTFPGIPIEHIGSTAVPGLMAKPVIDIMLLVPEVPDRCEYESKLHSLGYEFVLKDDSGRLFFRKGHPRTHHLHIVQMGGTEALKHLTFRDYLISHPETASEYVRLKLELAHRFRHDRSRYVEGKSEFIEKVTEKALARLD